MASGNRARKTLSQRTRLATAGSYAVLLFAEAVLLTGEIPPVGSLAGLWFYTGVVTLLVAAFLAEPYHTTPAQGVATGLALFLSAAAASTTDAAIPTSHVDLGRTVLMTLGFAITFAGISAIVARESGRIADNAKAATAWFSGQIGRPSFAFGSLYFASAYAAFGADSWALFVSLSTWVLIVIGAPVERALVFVARLKAGVGETEAHIETVVDPRTLILRRTGGGAVTVGDRVQVHSTRGSVAGTVVDASEMFSSRMIRLSLDAPALVDAGQIVRVISMPADHSVGEVVGFAVPGTASDELRARIHPTARHARLEEGALVECAIGDLRVMYLITESRLARDEHGDTDLEFVEARGRKVGRWNASSRRFEAVSWVPFPGAPVVMVAEPGQVRIIPDWVGLVPGTPYGVEVDIEELVTHNSAILGILGIGKTTLAWQLIQRMLVGEIKVVVLDITRRYAPYFDQVWTPREDDEVAARIAEMVAKKIAPNLIVRKLLEAFASSDGRLAVLNPADFMAPGQTLADVTKLFAEELLTIARARNPAADPEGAKFCLVLEEAHSLVPEWNSAVDKSEQYAVNATCRALLQGRKYGLGVLVVTQRTANVSKSLLNQCNTIFAMRVFDATGMEFLENYIGSGYTALLGSLRRGQAILFGHAIKTTVPLVVDVYDSKEFRSTYWEPNVTSIPETRLVAPVPKVLPPPTS